MLQVIKDRGGFLTEREAVYHVLSTFYHKNYINKYDRRSVIVDPLDTDGTEGMTNEQICELMAGEVKKADGVCKVVERNQKGVRGRSFPLAEVKEHYSNWREYGSIFGPEITK